MVTPAHRSHLLALSSLALAAILLLQAGCGGGGSGPSKGAISLGLTRKSVPVNVTLPPSFPLSASSLTVQTGAGASGLSSAGTADVAIFEPGYQLARVYTPDGKLVLMGWLRDGATAISPHTTAEAMLYFDLAAYLLSADLRYKVVDELATLPAVQPLADAISTALQTNPNALEADTPAITTARKVAVTAITGHTLRSRSVLINPSNAKDGVSVLQEGFNTIRIRNDYRRRAVAYVERVSYKPQGATTQTPSPAPVAGPIDVSPTVSVTSVTGALGDLVAGQVAYAGVTGDPIPLPLAPDTAATTTYRVLVLGMGGKPGNVTSLTPEQRNRLILVSAKTVFIDFFMPILVNVLMPIKGEAVDDVFNRMHVSDIFEDLVNFLGTQLPGTWEKASNGDLKGALTDLFDAVRGSNSIRVAIFEAIYRALHDQLSMGQLQDFTKQGEAFLLALERVDAVLTLADSTIQAAHIAGSGRAESWDVTISKDTVRLNPATASLVNGSTQTLTATTQTGATQVYHWTTTGKYGHIADTKGHSGKDFESSDGSVQYIVDTTPPTGQSDTDTVKVTVSVIPDTGGTQQRIEIGSATSTLTISHTNQQKFSGRYVVKTDVAGEVRGFIVVPAVLTADRYDIVITGRNDPTRLFGLSEPYVTHVTITDQRRQGVINGEFWIQNFVAQGLSPADQASLSEELRGIWAPSTIEATAVTF